MTARFLVREVNKFAHGRAEDRPDDTPSPFPATETQSAQLQAMIEQQRALIIAAVGEALGAV